MVQTPRHAFWTWSEAHHEKVVIISQKLENCKVRNFYLIFGICDEKGSSLKYYVYELYKTVIELPNFQQLLLIVL